MLDRYKAYQMAHKDGSVSSQPNQEMKQHDTSLIGSTNDQGTDDDSMNIGSVRSNLIHDDATVGCMGQGQRQGLDGSAATNNLSESKSGNMNANDKSDVHPIRQVINLGFIPATIDVDPGPMPSNIYSQSIIVNYK